MPREFKNWVENEKVGTNVNLIRCQRLANCRATGQHWSVAPVLRSSGTSSCSLSSLARVEWVPPSKIIKEVVGWCVEYAQGLYRDWFKDVTGTKVNILLLFAGNCHLCCCFASASWAALLRYESASDCFQWASNITTCRSAWDERDAIWSFPVRPE